MGLANGVKTLLSSIGLLVVVVSLLGPLVQPLVPVLNEGSVVITGCSPGGLGFQLVKDILATQPKGVKVVCTVRKDSDAEALRQTFGTDRLDSFKVDVTDSIGLDRLAESLKDRKIIALVNNAGISKHSKLENIDYRDTFEVNVFGLLETSKVLIPALRKTGNGARLLNIGSMAGTFSRPGTIAYSASKRAVEAITDGMRLELGDDGISVSVIQPGFFFTKMCNDPMRCGAGIEEVTEAILHALFSSRPRTRYPCASIGVMSAYSGSKLAAVAPDRLLDYLIMAFRPKQHV